MRLRSQSVNALPSQGLARSLDDRRARLGFAVLDNDTFYSGIILGAKIENERFWRMKKDHSGSRYRALIL